MAEERADPRDRDDPERLAEEAKEQLEKHAAQLRAAKVDDAAEPAARYVP